MADVIYNGKRINGVTHIDYDPGTPDGDHTSITVRKPDGIIVFIDEANTISDKQLRKLNRMIEKSRYIGKRNTWISRLRYRWAKRRGRVQGEFYWSKK